MEAYHETENQAFDIIFTGCPSAYILFRILRLIRHGCRFFNRDKRTEQSVKEARSILECFGSSYENMIIALERDLKFSHEEAVYGADNCGADWKEEALRAARKCLEKNGEYSFEKMVFQLQIFNFTQEEAEDAAKQLKLLPDEDPEKWHHNGS